MNDTIRIIGLKFAAKHGVLPEEKNLTQPFEVDIEIKLGAGAYVCGEESALMESIEGKRGEVRFKPPFPPTSGLWEKPTIINNVETLTNIPPIIANGAEWFAGFGTEKSKAFAAEAGPGGIRPARRWTAS